MNRAIAEFERQYQARFGSMTQREQFALAYRYERARASGRPFEQVMDLHRQCNRYCTWSPSAAASIALAVRTRALREFETTRDRLMGRRQLATFWGHR